MTMTLIATVNVSSGTSITFTSIPQNGTDLMLVFSARNTAAAYSGSLTLAANGGGAYTFSSVQGNGTGTVSSSASSLAATINGSSGATGNFGSGTLIITNYTATTATAKNIFGDSVAENNSASTLNTTLTSAQGFVTAAVTSLTLGSSSSFVAGTTCSLYMITKGTGGATVS